MDKVVSSENSAPRQEDWAGVSEMQREMLGFMATRLRKDSDALREMVAHHDLNHASSIHSRWLAETVHDYLAESEKMVSMMTGPASKFMLAATGEKDEPATAKQTVA